MQKYLENLYSFQSRILFFLLLFFYWNFAQANSEENALVIPLRSSSIFLDSGEVQDSQSLLVARQINCQLVRNQGYFFELEAAEAIKYLSPKKILLRLRKDAKFHDGTSLTSEDVLASLNYIHISRPVFENLFSWIEKIEPLDKKTLLFTLKKETPQFLKVLSSTAYPIFKKSFLEKAKKNRTLWKKPLGCGGYKVVEFSDNQIRLEPVYRGLPIVFQLIQTNQIPAVEAEKYDIIAINILGTSKRLNNFNVINIFDPVQFFIGLNSKSKFWKNKYQRCKFLNDLNADKLLSAYSEPAIKANDLLPKGALGYTAGEVFIKKIKEIAVQANEYDKSTRLNPFCLAYFTLSIQDNKDAYLNIFKAIYPNTFMYPIRSTNKFGKSFIDSNCDAFLFALKSSYGDGYEYLTIFEDKNVNFSGEYNEHLSKMITQSQGILNPNKRAKYYQKITQEIGNQCIIKSLLTLPTKKIYVKKNLITPGIGLVPTHLYYFGKVRRQPHS